MPESEWQAILDTNLNGTLRACQSFYEPLKQSGAGRIVNIAGFNPAGVSNDTFRVEKQNRPLIFYRSQEKDSTIEIDLFYPKDHAHDSEKSVGKMRFVYGYVLVPDGKRWGWIPLDALKPAIKN